MVTPGAGAAIVLHVVPLNLRSVLLAPTAYMLVRELPQTPSRSVVTGVAIIASAPSLTTLQLAPAFPTSRNMLGSGPNIAFQFWLKPPCAAKAHVPEYF